MAFPYRFPNNSNGFSKKTDWFPSNAIWISAIPDMKTKRHKLNFGNRTVLEQLAICRRVADGFARLPAEHQAKFADTNVIGAADEADAACQEAENLKIALRGALQRRNQKVRAARDAASSAAIGIWLATNGDPAAMLASGLEIVRDKQPVGKPDAPANLRTLPTEFEGTARLRWKRPVRRCWFVVEATTDPAAQSGWKDLMTSFKQTCTVTGLKGGMKYWFRIAASNAHGQGPWSQPVSVWVK